MPRIISVLIVGAFLIASVTVPPAARADEAGAKRLFYKITVTDPGTKNQGWRGILYDEGGKPIRLAPGQTTSTNIGQFVSAECTTAWIPCGLIEIGMLKCLGGEHSEGNVIIDANPWEYRLYVLVEGSRSEGWWGEIARGGDIVTPPVDGRMSTPMGPFKWSSTQPIWGRHGWFPEAWGGSTAGPQEGMVEDTKKAAEDAAKALIERLKRKFDTPPSGGAGGVRG